MAALKLFIFFVYVYCANGIERYDDRARIYAKNGNLKIVAGHGRSIDFEAHGGSTVSINSINILTTLTKAYNATKLTEQYQVTLSSYNDRLEALETRGLEPGLFNSSNPADNMMVSRLSSRLYSLNLRFFRLNRIVRNITLLLSKDECESNPCRNGATCQDMYAHFLCHCAPGWEGPDCSIDINECARIQGTDLGCQNGGVCRNTIGSYACDCVNGFTGLHCRSKSIDCLTVGAELCGHGTCVGHSNVKGYKCLCDAGWTNDPTDQACTKDVDECALNHPPCAAGVPCINVPGSFYCGNCPPGFTGNGYHCNDINECDVNNGGCSLNPMTLCINTHGSRVCGPCPAGYLGDGTICSFQGVCNINNGGCHTRATCREDSRIGTQCTCPPGFMGNGIGPNGCIPSNLNLHACSPNPCINGICSLNASTGSYSCDCLRYYTGRNCDTLRSNACSPNPCQNGGTCQIVNNRIKCECKTGYTGTYCRSQLQGCGGTFRKSNGTLKYPMGEFASYNHRANCAWLIITNDTSKVMNVQFTNFDVEESPECRKDWLEIHDGTTTTDPTLGRFCGKNKPLNHTFTTTHNTLYLWFSSDSTNSGSGFTLTWNTVTPVCETLLIQTGHGSIKSPGSPGNYPINRDCNWRLFTSYDKRYLFQFFSLDIGDNSDCSADYVKFYSTLYPIRDENVFASFCNSSSPAPFYSPGSRVSIHFHSDNKETHRGFQLTYSQVEGIPGCGGTFSRREGIIQSSHPETDDLTVCVYKIQQSPGRKIRINFIKFDIDNIGGCSINYLEIHEGSNEDAPTVGRYCGSSLPPPYTSTSNQLVIKSSSSGNLAGKGWKIEYVVVCSSKFTDESGTFNASLSSDDATDCIYQIERPPGNVILLTMKINWPVRHYIRFGRDLIGRNLHTYQLQPNNNNCYFRYVEVRDGDHENATLLGKYCGVNTTNLQSTHNFLWIKVHFKTFPSILMNDPIIFQYSSLDVGCGGILRQKMGNIASPTHPDGYYPSNLNCKWTIIAPPQDVIKLTWMTFYIEESNECTYDNVQVFDNNTDLGSGSLIGKYCGSTLPPTSLSSSNIMTVTFKTDVTVNMDGFLASYVTVPEKEVCGGNYFTPSGVIKSPRYPDAYPTNRECTWTINVPPGQQIMLNITDFKIEYYSGCRYDWLEIRNGGTSASPLIGKYCGTKIPQFIPSHANKLYVFFKSDLSRSGHGFRITWESTATGCGGVLTSPSGSLISPHYPEPYSRNTECLWKIITSAGSRIQAVFSDINLERHITCMSDYVQIFDGSTINSNSLGRFCYEAPEPIKTSGNAMLVKFRSDVAFQGRGFQLHYSTVCRNTVKGFGGVIESPNFPNDYPEDQDCLWEIEVSDRNKINITFSHFELGRSLPYSRNSCQFDYVEIMYGEPMDNYEEQRTYTKYGKYCGQQSPGHVTLDSDHVQIRFVSDKLLLGSGFRLEWEIFGCGGILKKKSGTITSPNYPNSYPKSSVCEWRIEVDFGQSIQLEFNEVDIERDSNCDFDSVSVYNGLDDKYNLLSKICRQKKKTIISSTGNYLFVKFKSDPSYQGKGFSANYSTIPTTCGGKMTAVEGYIYSPNYPKNYNKNETCEWYIDVDEGHSVELVFEDVDLMKTDNCLQNYVKIHDGPSAAFPVLKSVCGAETPNDTIKSTYNNVFIEFRAHSILTTKGFKLKYHKSCGSRITTQSNGIIEVHQDDFTDLMQSCNWVIVSTDPAKHVSLTISHLSAQYYCEESDGSVKVYNGQTSDSPLIGQYCGPKVPPTLVSDGSAISVDITSQTTFFATYTVIDSQCGGTLTASEGYFASPGYPKKYPSNVECEWTLQISPGNHVSLSFIEFDLPDSENCNTNYLEIRTNNASGNLLGVFCGSNEPDNITHVGSLWLLFRSSQPEKGDIVTSKGFYAEYLLNTENELSGDKGEIWSPLYPLSVSDYKTYTWKITVASKKRVLLSFKEFYLDAKDSIDDECYFATFEVFDGVDDTAESFGKLCGLELPKPIKSTSNIMLIKVEYNSPRLGSRFKVSWLQVDGSVGTTTPLPVTNTNCGNYSDQVININTLHNFTLTSPGYPGGYEPNLKCSWTFTTIPMNHLMLYIFDIDLAVFRNRITVFQNCQLNDYINVYQKYFYDNDWQKVKTICKSSDAEHPIMTTDLMKIEFVTTRYLNGTGFKAKILEDCGGWLREPTGYIVFNSTTVRGSECQWNVTVQSTKTIEITFEFMHIEYDANKGCDNFLMIRNGKFSDSPMLGSGKYCGTNLPEKLRSTANNLYIKYKGSSGIQGFRLKYQEVGADCGGKIALTRFDNSTEISSPNYPNIPNPHIECTWLITAPIGESLRIDFEDRFDLTFKLSCNVEYVELRDGGTDHSKLIGRYCYTAPSSQFSSDNMLFIKFFTDTDDPKNGFKAKVSLERCGGTVRGAVGELSYISPGNGKVNCTWHIVGPQDHYLTLAFTQLDVPTCTQNYVQVTQVNLVDNIVNSTTAKYCGTTLPKPFISDNNEVIVHLITDGVGKFSLKFNASQNKCGGELNADSGTIESPGYPLMNHLHRNCKWYIQVPEGRRITLTFVDFDIGGSLRFDRAIALYDGGFLKGANRPFLIVTKPPINNTFETSSNKLSVIFYSPTRSDHRGFKATYSSNLPTICEGDFSRDSGVIKTPSLKNFMYNCEWTHRNTDIDHPKTVAISVTVHMNTTLTHISPVCTYAPSFVEVVGGNNLDSLGKSCSSITDPVVIRSPYSLTILKAVANMLYAMNFTATYTTHDCGGTVHGQTGVIVSPNFPNKPTKGYECAWLLTANIGQTINVTLTDFNLGDDCEKSYLIVYNGRLSTDPKIGKFCKQAKPEILMSQSNNLLIEYKHDSSSTGVGFHLSYEATSSGCGGIFHDRNRNIHTPNFGSGDYPNNAECLWVIEAQPGFRLKLSFVDRFHLEQSNDCANDFVEVWQWDDDKWVSMGKRCGRGVPTAFESKGQRMKILFRSNDKITGRGFKASWEWMCGGIFVADKKPRYIVSPGYPQLYQKNLKCDYTISSKSSTSEALNLKFLDFFLEQGNPECKYDNLTIMGRSSGSYVYSRNTYCGEKIPPPMRMRGVIVISFETDEWLNRRGFKLEYKDDSCGGEINEETVIEREQTNNANEVGVNAMRYYQPKVHCVWNITAPPNQAVILTITKMDMFLSQMCFGENLEVYNSLDMNRANRLASLCGNLQDSYQIPSETGKMLVKLESMANRFGGFQALVRFSHGPAEGCGGFINLTESKTIRSPNLANLDCGWKIVAERDHTIEITINKLEELSQCGQGNKTNTTCDCMFVEIRDGASPLSEIIDTFCTSVSSVVRSTSASTGYVRFFMRGLKSNALEITLRPVMSICGSSILIATNEKKELLSPNFGSGYPARTRCSYSISGGGRFDKIAIHFDEFDLTDEISSEPDSTGNRCPGDYVQIFEDPNANTVNGLGSEIIYHGVTKHGSLMFSDPKGRHIFCGKDDKPFDYYSTGNVTVSLISKAQLPKGKGFKITYSVAGCNRNYTEEQGRINNGNGNIPECTFWIIVPQNRTISVYFSSFYMYYTVNCTESALEIRDGSPTGTVLMRACGYRLPDPIFSTTNQLYFKAFNKRFLMRYDMIFTSSDAGRGCGGDIFNNKGKIYSPMYPNAFRNDSECVWNIRAPSSLHLVLKFTNFDIQGKCEQTNVKIVTTSNLEVNTVELCRNYQPGIIYRSDSYIHIYYTSSIHNGGAGWIANFQAVTKDVTDVV